MLFDCGSDKIITSLGNISRIIIKRDEFCFKNQKKKRKRERERKKNFIPFPLHYYINKLQYALPLPDATDTK